MSTRKPKRPALRQGAHFYRQSQGLLPILVYVPKEIHQKLKQKALEEDRSLQKTVKRILVDHLSRQK